jgi:hypothetical protein
MRDKKPFVFNNIYCRSLEDSKGIFIIKEMTHRF